ncbi:hypothetical protein DH09_10125 [Bacillaceae bacterium JMAK1]|nr:hypothetical protein DH09_10125 [Bacillaceae bacterium JMAK1]
MEANHLLIDDRVEEVLTGLSAGKTREQLAIEFGHKNYKALDIYMRRKGYRWIKEEGIYELEMEKDNQTLSLDTKASNIIAMLDEKEMNTRKVADKFYFRDHKHLGEYMSAQGYMWNAERMNYVWDGVADLGATEVDEQQVKDMGDTEEPSIKRLEKYMPMLEMLMNHQEELETMFGMQTNQLPRYKVPGQQSQVTAVIVGNLYQLLKSYSKEKNVTQKEIIQIALIEFFQKYGYNHQVDRLMNQ